MTVMHTLQARCAALGTRLFTVTALDDVAGVHLRLHTSDPVAYPVSGTKPLDRDDWYDRCVASRSVFVAATPDEVRHHLADHALIFSLGLGSCVNAPVVAPASDGGAADGGGRVLGTVNLLAPASHYTDAVLRAHLDAIAEVQADLCAALLAALPPHPRPAF